MIQLESQIHELLSEWPEWNMNETKDSYILEGSYVLNSEYNDVPFYERYDLEMTVSKIFPRSIPTVKLSSYEIPEDFEHINHDGTLCLGSYYDIFRYLDKKPNIKLFIEEIVDSYLYSLSFFKQYKYYPFGERRHGIAGEIDSFLEKYKLRNGQYDVLYKFLLILSGKKQYRGYEMCPCGSHMKLRKCHGRLIKEDMEAGCYYSVKRIALNILDHMSYRRNNEY